jgi:iron complex outermembrane receptor protein
MKIMRFHSAIYRLRRTRSGLILSQSTDKSNTGSLTMKVRSISMAGVTLVATNVLSVSVAHAAEPAAAPVQTIVVTATRVEQSSFDLPVSIDVVTGEQMQDGQFMVNASESLARVPGIVAPNTNRFSSDQLISSRGFGARSTFGIRGIRLYADGIPQTMPDGQGQLSTFSLSSAERMEVMRGPFSVLYGNSSGGVIQIFTRDGKGAPRVTGSAYGGSFGTWRADVQAEGGNGGFGYLLDASRFQSDGYREHNAVRRDQVNSKLTWQVSDQTKATVVLNSLDQPYNQDPQGLSRADLDANRQKVNAAALTYNAGGNKSQQQIGVNIEHRLTGTDTLQAIVWTGVRDTMTRLSTPPPSNPATIIKGSGGIGFIDRNFYGTDMRWSHKTATATGPLTITAGLTYESMKDVRTGYDNNSGVQGVLRRDEDNIAANSGLYLQAEWELGKDWIVSGGVRQTRVSYENKDRYIKTPTNPDDSGSVSYSNTTPVLGVVYHLTPAINLYANAGKGFDTPAFIELAYRPGGVSGLNFALTPSTSVNYEAGMKAFVGANTRVNLALFQVNTDKEIVVDSLISGSRSVYANAGKTERSGLELSIDSDLGNNFKASLAYSLLDARFKDAYTSSQTTIRSGNKLPGTPRDTWYGELAWKHPGSGFSTAIEAHYSGKVYVNDRNSDAAASYTVVNWRGGFEQRFGKVRLSEFLRIENLGDKMYVGAVLVNSDTPFTPAPGRNYLAGVSAGLEF